MNYELAKQLKDAGFPVGRDGYFDYIDVTLEDDKLYIPTLSELIEACGETTEVLLNPGHLVSPEYTVTAYFSLSVRNQTHFGCEHCTHKEEGLTWTAEYPVYRRDFQGTYPKAQGKTPEEAVAKLWLELNKKTT